MLQNIIFIIFVSLCFSAEDVTFKNVTFRGYRRYTEKFNRTIPSSNSLKEYLPRARFDQIVFKEQYIPVLRENSLADLRFRDLIIENCQVTEIQPGALRNVPLLRGLSLKGNRLEEIEEGVFNNLNVSILVLSLNSISRIASGAFDDLPKISEIFLDDNRIGTWNPNWFKNTPHLTTIFMNNNSIGMLPKGAFKNLQGHNSSSRAIFTIILSYNQIEKIAPGVFAGLKRFKYLWLDHNRLEDIDEDLLADVEIHDLRLGANNIRCLDGNLGKIIKADKTDLDLNPFDCECLKKIEVWRKKNGKHANYLISNLECLTQEINKTVTSFKKVFE